jgi:hypothetical protein
MENLDVVEIIKCGAIGLFFLLAVLAYMLLRKEQELKKPRKIILISISGFAVLIFAFGVLAFIVEIRGSLNQPSADSNKIIDLPPPTPSPPLPRNEPNKKGILLDLSHGQDNWQRESGSIFNLTSGEMLELVVGMANSASLEIKTVTDRRQITSKNLVNWTGMILGIPRKAKISPTTRDALVKWVHSGGRLVLLGFELGDRHHEGNLNFLANEFGIRFNSDIVAPSNWSADGDKPYDEAIEFKKSEFGEHKIFGGINRLLLENLCTLTVEPGSNVLLTLGNHKIGWMTRESASYDKNHMLTSADQKYEFLQASWVPVIAEAPAGSKGLTGKGRVLAIGTWGFFGVPSKETDVRVQRYSNVQFVENLLTWLAGS